MSTLHVDEFIALNDELRALTRSGIALPVGLRAPEPIPIDDYLAANPWSAPSPDWYRPPPPDDEDDDG